VVSIGGNARLSNNNLSGTLNPSLENLTEMEIIRIDSNIHLVGTLPKELRSWKKFQTLYIPSNGFDGELPPELSEWESINTFGIWNNHFTGVLPKEYGNWTTIRSFFPESNNFVGTLPEEYGVWDLEHFTINNNKIT
jgi:hypothetical protein